MTNTSHPLHQTLNALGCSYNDRLLSDHSITTVLSEPKQVLDYESIITEVATARAITVLYDATIAI